MVSTLLEVIEQKPTKKLVRPQNAIAKNVSLQGKDLHLTKHLQSGYQADVIGEHENNYYLDFAKPILTLLTQIKMSIDVPDVAKLHQQAVTEMSGYIADLEGQGLSTFLIDCSAYCLCAALDEAVLSKDWGTQSVWVQESLLSMFRSETLGGERFYLITEKMCEEPRKSLGVIELIYTLLSLGFEGQYYGPYKEQRNQIKNQLFQVITQTKGKIAKNLSPQSLDNQTIIFRKKRKIKIRRLLASAMAVLFALYFWYSYAIYQVNQSNMNALARIGREAPVTTFSQFDRQNNTTG